MPLRGVAADPRRRSRRAHVRAPHRLPLPLPMLPTSDGHGGRRRGRARPLRRVRVQVQPGRHGRPCPQQRVATAPRTRADPRQAHSADRVDVAPHQRVAARATKAATTTTARGPPAMAGVMVTATVTKERVSVPMPVPLQVPQEAHQCRRGTRPRRLRRLTPSAHPSLAGGPVEWAPATGTAAAAIATATRRAHEHGIRSLVCLPPRVRRRPPSLGGV